MIHQNVVNVIYDFGMNNGDNLEYYLLKAPKVVGVEANVQLCDEVRVRFAEPIAAGRLSILNVALVNDEALDEVTFYLSTGHHVISRLEEPEPAIRHGFRPVRVAARTPASVIHEFGTPDYVKIDVEGSDVQVLKNMFDAGIKPPEVSAEAHSVEVFACLVANNYTSFCLVDGLSVPNRYGQASIVTPQGSRPFSFKSHSAGPFGEDIRESWEDADAFLYTLASAFLGWKDIHASRVIPPVQTSRGIQQILRRQTVAVARHWASGIRRTLVRGSSN
jgi:FkbM family methyltransferase